MPARRGKSNDDSATRTALLDAAEAPMLQEGYAAVTSRRIAARVGLPNAIHCYFETMDQIPDPYDAVLGPDESWRDLTPGA